jgi:hypothetical protein
MKTLGFWPAIIRMSDNLGIYGGYIALYTLLTTSSVEYCRMLVHFSAVEFTGCSIRLNSIRYTVWSCCSRMHVCCLNALTWIWVLCVTRVSVSSPNYHYIISLYGLSHTSTSWHVPHDGIPLYYYAQCIQWVDVLDLLAWIALYGDERSAYEVTGSHYEMEWRVLIWRWLDALCIYFRFPQCGEGFMKTYISAYI